MPPNVGEMEVSVSGVTESCDKPPPPAPVPAPAPAGGRAARQEVVWPNVVKLVVGHGFALHGLWLCCSGAVMWQTMLLALVLYVVAELGITAGAHRLWTHRTYKATRPLEILLMLFNCVAFQNTAADWVRDHRMHHKYSDTDADPHNPSRGFWFAHIGWLLVRKHPEVKRRGRTVDMSDIYANPVLNFQRKYAMPLISALCFLLPTALPVMWWGERLVCAWHMAWLRYIAALHCLFLVNSAAHTWGTRPYDRHIQPTQNLAVSVAILGEGFHNYHHTFPWDYRASELGDNYLNFTTKFIDFFASIGWAYDLKSVSQEIVDGRKRKTGDGSDLGKQASGAINETTNKY